MNNASRTQDEILITDDVLSRYKISRSTLYFWSTPSRMPSHLSCPFPQPTINGSPKRWRLSDILKWEDSVGFKSEADRPASQDGPAIPPASGADHPGNREGCNAP